MLALWQQNKRMLRVKGKWIKLITVLINNDTSLTFTCNSPPDRLTSFKRKELLTQKALCSHKSVLFRTKPVLLAEIVGSQGHLSFH